VRVDELLAPLQDRVPQLHDEPNVDVGLDEGPGDFRHERRHLPLQVLRRRRILVVVVDAAAASSRRGGNVQLPQRLAELPAQLGEDHGWLMEM
jgi:hypothetical protein